jgi:predicted HTH transcriptional regulator
MAEGASGNLAVHHQPGQVKHGRLYCCKDFSSTWSLTGVLLVFFLRSQAEQVRRLEKKVEREKIVLATLPELSLQIVEFAREHGRITIGDAIKLTGVSRNTLKQHFRNLVEHGHLNQQGIGRGVWYELK